MDTRNVVSERTYVKGDLINALKIVWRLAEVRGHRGALFLMGEMEF